MKIFMRYLLNTKQKRIDFYFFICYNVCVCWITLSLTKPNRGVAQLVARLVRDQEVVGSNPVASTKTIVSPLVVRLFLILLLARGFEGGSRFVGAKRFALRNLDYGKLDGKGRR